MAELNDQRRSGPTKPKANQERKVRKKNKRRKRRNRKAKSADKKHLPVGGGKKRGGWEKKDVSRDESKKARSPKAERPQRKGFLNGRQSTKTLNGPDFPGKKGGLKQRLGMGKEGHHPSSSDTKGGTHGQQNSNQKSPNPERSTEGVDKKYWEKDRRIKSRGGRKVVASGYQKPKNIGSKKRTREGPTKNKKKRPQGMLPQQRRRKL